jgi:hypothetical protein
MLKASSKKNYAHRSTLDDGKKVHLLSLLGQEREKFQEI